MYVTVRYLVIGSYVELGRRCKSHKGWAVWLAYCFTAAFPL